ncbi:MAG TPA: hypothetical protein DEB25_06500 [Desulfobulbaceae bacterium]|nr:hypothetical protein [Desulfobulbaceae bacterium]
MAGCRIFIDVVVVSEFINAYARSQWNASGKPGNFKQFRNSPAFQPIAGDIADAVRLILKHCQRLESGFASLDMNTVLDDYAAGNTDFNDKIIAALCQEKGFKLVTDDSDFAGQALPILTANRRMLKATAP